MTTRSRARWARVAALIALTGGTLAVSAAPVVGAAAPVSILSVSAENVKPGDKVRIQFRVTNNGSGAETAIVVVGGGLQCTTGCRVEPNLKPGQSQDFQATVVAPQVRAGEISGLNISVGVRLDGQNIFDFKMVYVYGPGTSQPGAGAPQPSGDKPSSEVDGVSGQVRDTSGKAIGGVALTVRDSAGHEYRTTSDRSGRFSIKSGAGKTIAEGRITVVAALDGYRTSRTTVQGSAGDTATVRLTLAAVATPATTAPSPTATAADEAPGPETSVATAAPPALEAVSDEGSGSLPFILGGLLVVAGLGALALMGIRRRNTPDKPAPHVATQLTAPAGAGMSDAPTAVLHTRPPADGLPGPYSGPQQGGVQQLSHEPYGGPAR
ncbi:carboxypeptidase-like regulatory domain-containing protein [Micromonospora chaiyaphumensis]|uniref:Carboxypeptidase regulatory-like domain-containing protein n=1 Tax=Micromonospora chaiyaphumensis TaxID=307119 RepID=A0A1C4W9X4_9ACTN|nr:carboxypeptidase-like regulatory domain-containing protein [Micromonospora chaiyaphumensis]SCE92990.1 Carboxypeptidase regulatory-like domain-containing protein [Micromonospora chaiyaphumensis]